MDGLVASLSGADDGQCVVAVSETGFGVAELEICDGAVAEEEDAQGMLVGHRGEGGGIVGQCLGVVAEFEGFAAGQAGLA